MFTVASTALRRLAVVSNITNPRFLRRGGVAGRASRVIYHRWRYSGSVSSDPSCCCPHLQECLCQITRFLPAFTTPDWISLYSIIRLSDFSFCLTTRSYRVARSKYVLTAPDFLDALFALVPAPVRPPVAACCVAAQSKRAQRPENPGLFDSRSRRLWRCLPMHIFNHPTNAPESQHLTFINHCLPETRDPKLGSGHEAARILTREPKVCAVVEPEAQGTWHPKA